MIKKYVKKAIVVEAVLWNGDNFEEVKEFCGEFCDLKDDVLLIGTLEDKGEQKHQASVGDYIIKGIKGEFYPCKPDIFEATYSADLTKNNQDEITKLKCELADKAVWGFLQYMNGGWSKGACFESICDEFELVEDGKSYNCISDEAEDTDRVDGVYFRDGKVGKIS